MKDFNFPHSVTLYQADFETPFIASIPHSGMYIPPEIIDLYTDEHLNRLRNTDWHLPTIYDFLPSLGVSVVQANFSRYVIDVNRGLHQKTGGRSYRSSLIYHRDTWGDPILKNPHFDMKEDFRIANFWQPYHRILEAVIQNKIKQFGHACLLDLHSFAVNVYPRSNPNTYPPDAYAEIYLGAGDFSEFGPNLKTSLFSSFNHQGLKTGDTINFPGGHIVKYYGARKNVEACMIELKYATYMPDSAANGDHIPQIDPTRATITKTKLKRALTKVVTAPSHSYPLQKRLAL